MKTTFRRLGAAARALALMLGFIAASQTAHAACTGPSGIAGDMIYASNYNSMAFCNGTTWTSMAGGVSVTVNTSGGGATPAGSSADVQFNSSGALAADTGNFTYSGGLLTTPNINTGNVSATTINASGLGTFGSVLINGGITATGQASLTTISTTYIQVQSATTVTACGSGLTGTMRYTSGTMQVCDGSGWTNIGLGVPQGTIAAFALTSCPNGWSEYTPARGRFLRGIDNGAGIDPAGTRAPGNQQADAFQGHSHEFYVTANEIASGGGNGIRTNASTVADTGPFSSFVRNPISDGTNGTPRTANETRPTNVAVTFCRYDGFQSQLQTGVATLASLTDVSVAGAATGQVLTYSGGMWVASSTTGGTAQGDRITSGTLSIIANTGTAYASLTTNGTTWGYFSSGANYLPNLQTDWLNNGTISTSMVQFGANSTTCTAGYVGSVKFSATSDTIQICTSAGWTSVASSSVPNTTISQGTANYGAIFSGPNTLVTDSALYVDRTSHRVGIGVSSPQGELHVSGTAILSALYANNTTTGDNFINMAGTTNTNEWIRFRRGGSPGGSAGNVYSNYGTSHYFVENTLGNLVIAYSDEATETPSRSLAVDRFKINPFGNVVIGSATSLYSSLTIVNGEVQTGSSGKACSSSTNGGAIRYSAGTLYYCNGSNTWTSLGGGGVGSPAGTTKDVQFNSGGAFSADTGKFVWDAANHRLGIGVSSPTASLDISQTDINGVSINIANTNGTELAFNGASANANIINFGNGSGLSINSTNGPIFLGTGGAGTQLMQLRGNTVGIGIISSEAPVATLQVSGSFIVSNSASPSSPSLYIGTNGEVSIGSTTNAWLNSGSGLYVARHADHFGMVIAGDPGYQADLVLMTTQNSPDQHGVQLFNSGDQFGIRTVTDAGLPGKSLFTANLTTGSVGISNTNPIAKLDVVGTVSASDAIQVGASSLTCAASINGAIRWNSAVKSIDVCRDTTWTSLSSNTTAGGSPAGSTGDIQFNTAGSFDADTGKLYWDKVNDELGVGTSEPSATLHATGTGTPYAMFGPSGTGAIELRKDDNASGFFIRNDGVNPVISTKVGNLYFGYGSHSGMALNFYTSNTFAGTWDPNGRLGIGTAAPAYTLDVSGYLRIRNPSASQVMIDTTATGQQAALGFYSNGSNKWQIGKNNGDQFFVWDSSATRTAINVYSNGSMGLMPDSGNVGIGTYTPGSRFDVSSTSMRLSTTGGSNTPYMEWYKDGGRQAYIGWGSPGAAFNITMEANNPLYINASTTVVSQNLTVGGNVTGSGNMTYAQAYGLASSVDLNTVVANGNYRLGGTPVNAPSAGVIDYGELIVSRGYDTILQIAADYYSGNLFFRSGNPSNVGGTGSWGAWRQLLYNGMTANVSIAGNVTASAFLYSSDKRLKSDFTQLTGGLAKLDALNPVSFRFTADPSKTIHLGLIAQDVQKVYPEAVKADDKGFLKLDYPALIGPIVDMLKEMKEVVLRDHDRIAVANTEIAKLQAANDNMASTIVALHKDNDDIKQEVDVLKAANAGLRDRVQRLEGKAGAAR